MSLRSAVASRPPQDGLTLQRSWDLSPSRQRKLHELLFASYSLLTLYLIFLFLEKFLHLQPLPASASWGNPLTYSSRSSRPPPHAAACSSCLLCWTLGGGPFCPLHCRGLGVRTDMIYPPVHHTTLPDLQCSHLGHWKLFLSFKTLSGSLHLQEALCA